MLSPRQRCSLLKHFRAHSHACCIRLPWFHVLVTHNFGAIPKNRYFEPHPPFRGKRLPAPMQHVQIWASTHSIGYTPCYVKGPTQNWDWLICASLNQRNPICTCELYFDGDLPCWNRFCGIKFENMTWYRSITHNFRTVRPIEKIIPYYASKFSRLHEYT